CQASAMFQYAIKSLNYHLTYYCEFVVNWWDNIGLDGYLGLLIGAFLLGCWLLKSDPLKTL
ncbi:MAG: hypothetical protein ACKVII_27220, partial [Planctomycetales bacterium]